MRSNLLCASALLLMAAACAPSSDTSKRVYEAPTQQTDEAADAARDAVGDARPHDALEGTYRHAKMISMYDSLSKTTEEHDVTDCLRIERIDENTLSYSGDTIWTNGHLCTFSGKATQESANLFVSETLNPGTEDVCRFEIHVDDDTIRLADPHNTCRAHACGARASIDGTVFPRNSRTTEGICDGAPR